MAETQIRLDTQAEDNTLVNSKIVDNVITLSKLASIGDGKIIVGAVSTGYPTAVTTTGDVVISDTGATAIQSGVIVDSEINASAAITLSKLYSLTASKALASDASGVISATSVTSTELGYVSGVTSAIQTQLNGKQTTVLHSADILVGSNLDVATEVAMSGDVHIDNTGSTTIQSGAVTGSKIASSTITNTNVASGDFLAITGIGTQDQALNMGSNFIHNVTDPSSNQDAATKHYVDTTAATTVLPTDNVFIGNGSNVATAVPVTGDVHIAYSAGNGVTTIQANAIVDSKVSATAAIAITKLDTGSNAQIMISNGTTNNWETVSGDIHIDHSGVTSIQSGVIVDADVNASANIALSKLADGTNILLADTSKTIANLTRYTYVTAQTFVNSGDLVDKAYVDSAIVGLTVKAPVLLATTARLVSTYNNGTNGIGATLTATTNGALTVDGVLVSLGNRILVKDNTDIPLDITSFGGTTQIFVTSNAGVQVGDPIDQQLSLNITGTVSTNEIDVTSNVGVISGDIIQQGAYYASVVSLGGTTQIFVNSNTGFTTGTAYDATQVRYHHTTVTGTVSTNEIDVLSNVGFYSGTGGVPHDSQDDFNGIYTVTTVGDGSHAWVLTRATDFDSSLPNGVVEPGDYTFVTSGSINATSSWIVKDLGFTPISVGIDDIEWVQFNASNTYQAGSGLTLSGNVFNVVSSNTGITVNAHDIALTLADSTLTISSGLKLSPLLSAYILVGNGSNVATGVAMSGDVAIDNTGDTTVTSSIPRFSSFITREVPTGLVNSSNRVFTLAHTPVTGTECVYLNGLLQTEGSGFDYTISGNTITFTVQSPQVPETGSILVVNYQK